MFNIKNLVKFKRLKVAKKVQKKKVMDHEVTTLSLKQ